MREWEMFVCRCGSSALGGPEEVVHFNNQCPGRHDETVIERFVLVPKDSESAASSEVLDRTLAVV
jgi:hypothetical protein